MGTLGTVSQLELSIIKLDADLLKWTPVNSLPSLTSLEN